jgi:hypothetical protein
MSEALGTLIFIFVFIVVPWGLILTLRLVGRCHGYDILYAPPQDEPPADRPLRWRLTSLLSLANHADPHRRPLPTLRRLWEDPCNPNRRAAAVGSPTSSATRRVEAHGPDRPCRARPADPIPGRGGPQRRRPSAPGQDRNSRVCSHLAHGTV